MIKRALFPFIMVWFAAFGVTSLYAAGSLPPTQPEQPSSSPFGIQKMDEKREAPSFSLKALDGKNFSLVDFKGKPILLVFWASWCPGCMEELPLLEKFVAGKKDQLNVITLAIDGQKESKIRRIARENKLTFPILFDVNEKVARAYGINFVPAAVLINQESQIVGKIIGERDWSSPEAGPCIKQILAF